MTRYILIENNSGYIWGDSADLNGKIFDGTPEEFAAALDASIHEYDRTYEMIGHNPRSTEDGYHVYRADVGGSEAVMVANDGQDQEMIDAVERDCQYLGFIRVSRTDETME